MMKYRNIIVIVFGLLEYCNSNENDKDSMIEIQYSQGYFSDFINIYSGEPLYSFKTVLNLQSYYTWIDAYTILTYNSKSSTTIRKGIKFTYENSILHSHEITDSLSFTNHNEPPFLAKYHMYLINNDFSIPDTRPLAALGLGIPLNDDDTQYSIIHQFKAKGFIHHASFSIVNPHYLYLGGIPIEYTQTRFLSYCNLYNPIKDWNCLLRKVSIQSVNGRMMTHTLDNGVIVRFTTDNHMNYIDKEFFDILVEEVFKEEIQREKFKVGLMKGKKHIYTWDGSNINDANITFTIGDYSYEVRLNDFWNCYSKMCDLDLYYDPYNHDKNNDWVLGSEFIRIANTYFDYEMKRIYFYTLPSLTKVTQVNTSNDYEIVIKSLLLMNTIMMFIGINIIVLKAFLIRL